MEYRNLLPGKPPIFPRLGPRTPIFIGSLAPLRAKGFTHPKP